MAYARAHLELKARPRFSPVSRSLFMGEAEDKKSLWMLNIHCIKFGFKKKNLTMAKHGQQNDNEPKLGGLCYKIFYWERWRCSIMDKLQLTGLNLGQVFNSKGGRTYAMHSGCY